MSIVYERSNCLPNCLLACNCAAENSSHNWNLETLSAKLNESLSHDVFLNHLEVKHAGRKPPKSPFFGREEISSLNTHNFVNFFHLEPDF